MYLATDTPPSNRPSRAAWIGLLVLAIATYLLGLGSFYAPTNGDEMVYLHIARRTAESGHWLPLASDLTNMRNTKPPLLIWQAMVAGDWGLWGYGGEWNLWALRLPSVIYTFLTAAAVALLAHRWSGRLRTACLAAVLYLAFFSTFRYGRVYLTSAPETFWLALPLFCLLATRTPPGGSSGFAGISDFLGLSRGKGVPLLAYVLFGITIGLGCAYKSFALVAPATATLWCAVLLTHAELRWAQVWRATAGVALSGSIALAIFGLWFALDPDPAAVWREFVVGENAGKLNSANGYFYNALWGGNPIWQQALAYFENAGLLGLAAIGLAVMGGSQMLRGNSMRTLAPHLQILLVWLLVWLVIFSLPSQRSARYVIPAMPALAVLMALYWERIARPWFWLTLLLAVPALVMLTRIAWVMGQDLNIAGADSALLLAAALISGGVGLGAVVLGLARPAWLRHATLVAVLSVYACFGAMVAPLGTSAAQYSTAVQPQVQGLRVAVPNGFNAQYERFRWALPGALITPYDSDSRNVGELYPDMPADARLRRLIQEFDAVVWVQEQPSQPEPSCAPGCRVIGQRWHVKSRHRSGEVTLSNLWMPQEWLFRSEWLIVRAP